MTHRIGYLGPPGTFTEQALLTQPDLADIELVAVESIPDVLAGVETGSLDQGFVPIENAIEGTVNVALDTLAFEADLLIQREVVIDISFLLLGVPGASLDGVKTVLSYPHALAQVRGWLRSNLPEASVQADTSTAEAARHVAEDGDVTAAAVSNALAARLYGLEPLATDIADHGGNQTRFVLVGRDGVPAPTGHDKTSLVIHQRADAPGSLLAILQEFAARRINLVKLESRPTRQGLGDYCFMLDLEGHVADEVVGDCLVNLRAKQQDVKFLGSYPAAGDQAEATRDGASASWREATDWLSAVRSSIDPG
ncbi:MAG: prephenate dehydratase [Actinomycetota bacterium]